MFTINLTRQQLSDLFFYHEKKNINSLYPEYSGFENITYPNTVEIQQALGKDAKEFAELLGNQIDYSWFIALYNDRV